MKFISLLAATALATLTTTAAFARPHPHYDDYHLTIINHFSAPLLFSGRKYMTDGWPQTLMAVNAIGYLCEAAYHHADLTVSYAKLWVKLMTHDAGGITDKDFELAKEIETLVLYRPAAGTALAPGNPKKFVFHKDK